MTGQQFRDLRLRAGLSTAIAARELGVARSTVTRWEALDADVPSSAAEWVAARAGATPEPRAARYALGRVMRCCADAWEAAGSALPLDLYEGVPVRPMWGLGQLVSRTRARTPRHFAAVEPEIREHMARIPAEGLPESLPVEDQGDVWLGYYHRGSDARDVRDADREDREG